MRILELQQGSAEWKAERAKYDTASEAPVMMGASKKATRSDLLKIKATGLEKEVSEWVEKNLFAPGHEIEAKARPIAEKIIGEELYPAVAVSDDEKLLASFDGITMLEGTIWECKQWNAEKAAAVTSGMNGECPIEDYWQVVQQLAVSGATACLYMVTDGTEENTVHCVVEPVAEHIQRLRDGWAQFNKDLENYEPPAAEKVVTGSAPSALPALDIRVSGSVVASNLDEFKAQAMAVFRGINTDLETDEDFADAEETVKWCKSIEKRLDGAKDAALNQTADIYEVLTSIDEMREEARKARLNLDKQVKARKEQRKEEILRAAERDYDAHIGAIERDIGRGNLWTNRFPAPSPMIAQAMKGKKTITSLQDAADTAVANAKIEADRIARDIRASIDVLVTEIDGYQTLFPDAGELVTSKSADDLRNLARARISKHQEQERQRAEREAEQQRIREGRQAESGQQRAERDQAPQQAAEHAVSQEPEVKRTPAQDVAKRIDELRPKRPSDDEIIACVAWAFEVDHTIARDWIAGMDLVGAES